MNLVLWIIVSIAFLVSLLMFLPSVMSLGAPVFKASSTRQKIQYKVSKTFLYLVLAYPVVFFFCVVGYRFFNLVVLPFLVIYVVVMSLLLVIWDRTS